MPAVCQVTNLFSFPSNHDVYHLYHNNFPIFSYDREVTLTALLFDTIKHALLAMSAHLQKFSCISLKPKQKLSLQVAFLLLYVTVSCILLGAC